MIAMRRQIDSLKYGTSASSGTSLRSQLNSKRSTLAEARQRYGAEHPDIKRLQRDIATLETRIKNGERGDVEMSDGTPMGMQLRTQINAIDRQLGASWRAASNCAPRWPGSRRNVTAAPQVEREYSNVTRDLTIAREKYEQLLNRQMDAEVSESAIVGGRADEFRLVQPPMLPAAPAKPAAPGHPADRPRGRGGAGPDRHRSGRSARSEGARRAGHPRPAAGVAAGRHPRHPQLAFAPAQRLALRDRQLPAASSACGSHSPSSRTTSDPRETLMSTTMEDAMRREFSDRPAAARAPERHRVREPAPARAPRDGAARRAAAGTALPPGQRRCARHGAPVHPARGLRCRGAARVQDPAHARAAPPRHAQVELHRGLRHVGGRRQDHDGDQPGAGAVAGREHLGVPGRPRPAASADRQLPRHELREGPVRLPARQGRARRGGLQPAVRAAGRDSERARVPAFLRVPQLARAWASSPRRSSARCRAAS